MLMLRPIVVAIAVVSAAGVSCADSRRIESRVTNGNTNAARTNQCNMAAT